MRKTPAAAEITCASGSELVGRCEQAAQRLYDAEVALHTAHTSHVGAWIAAASDRLHEAVEEHLKAVAALAPAGGQMHARS